MVGAPTRAQTADTLIDRPERRPAWGPGQAFVLAAWFGLAAGLFELALLVLRVQMFERGLFLRSPHFLWMVPVADLWIAAGWGLVLALAAWTGRPFSVRWALAGYLFLGCLGQLLLVRGLNSLACALLSAGIAWRLSSWLAPRLPALLRLARRGLPALLLIVAALVLAASARERSLRRPAFSAARLAAGQAPNVLLIVLDTVRADRLSVYGYNRATAPNLERLARQGTRFERARTPAPWTLPAHASMFTGRWPSELDVERLGRLGPGPPTLAEHLAGRGYATGGFVANQFFCGHESGLSRGFETYHDYPVTPLEVFRSSSLGWYLTRRCERLRDEWRWLTSKNGPDGISLDFARKPAAIINQEFLDWLGPGRKRPFFAFLNYFDAHDPYLPPQRPARPLGRPPQSRSDMFVLRDWQKLDKSALGPKSIALASDAYDDCIAALDEEIGRLLDELKRRRLLDNTLIVLTADHGEQFGEHGAFGHGLSLYEPEVHVPLLVVFPGHVPAGQVVRQPVSLRDLPATILDLIGPRNPHSNGAAPFPGVPFSQAWKELSALAAPPAFSELQTPIETIAAPAGKLARTATPVKAILDGSTVYIHHDDGSEELYDLDRDPAESQNLGKSASHQTVLDRCRQALDAIVKARPASAAGHPAGQ